MTKEPKELYNGFLFLRTGDKVDSPLGAYTLNLESVNIDCLEDEFEEKIEALKNGKDVTIKLVCNKVEVVSPERIIEYACGKQRQPEIEPESISKWKKEFREYVDSLDIARDDWKGIIEYIDEVPSAEQDTTTHDSIPVETGKNYGDRTSGDCISRTQAIDKFIDELEEIFSDIREREIDDSVCGLCEYDGAYIGQSGDWCNECPGFDRDDCFKLSDKIRKEWTDEIIKALPSIQPEQRWIPVSERLPEEGEVVLTQAKFKDDMKMAVSSRIDYNYWTTWGTRDINIVAWMPLPEPYQKGGE